MPTTLPARRHASTKVPPQVTALTAALLGLIVVFGAALSLSRARAIPPLPVRDSSPPAIFTDFGSPYLIWPIPIPP
jgi:hypothetical protein